ncbi:MAG: hypothetical protein GTN36_03395 [Candidatus Aenigmarchaeota archaeon]|nr:hypothetical protein [Candidatus Aenigmarchaeota archaeon]
MNDDEIKKEFIRLFENLIETKDLKERSKLSDEIRSFATKVIEDKKTSGVELKSKTLHESLEEFLNLPLYEDELLQIRSKRWLWNLKNE